MQKSFSQLPVNGGFESWAIDSSGYSSPVNWIANNGAASAATVLQAPGHSSASSVHFVSVSDSATGFIGGEVACVLDNDIKPLVLTGFWKGNFLIGGDRLGIWITVKDSNYQIITQAVFQTPILAYSTVWTPFTLTINYPTSVEPYQTIFIADIGTIGLSTEGYLDDLNLTYITSTNEIETRPLFSAGIMSDENIKPKLIIESTKNLSLNISIYNLDGLIIFSGRENINTGNNEFPLPFQSSSINFCTIEGNGYRKSLKYIIQSLLSD